MLGAIREETVVPTKGRQPHVLVVDNDFQIRNLLQSTLEDIGLVVLGAGSDAEARGLIAAGPVDFAFIAVLLPDGSGEALGDFLASRGTPVVLMSGHPEGIRRGTSTAHVFLAKPFSVKQVLRHVCEMMPSWTAK
jgi:DNA-binding NtrC family response regulator